MRFVSIFLLVVCLVFANSALALEVIRARYGTDRRYSDVSDIVQRYANQGVRSFYVNNETMRGDPDKGRKKFLTVEYVNRGRRYRDTVKEGTHFRFEGPLIPGGGDFHFPPGIPGRPVVEVTFNNESDVPIRIYSINEYGSYQWIGAIAPGRSLVAPATIGQELMITDTTGRTLERKTIRRPNERIVIGGGFFDPGDIRDDYYYGGGGGYVGNLRIQNTLRAPVHVYTVNIGRDWQYVESLPPGASSTFPTEPGRRWVVTDYSNRVLREVRAQPGSTVLRVP